MVGYPWLGRRPAGRVLLALVRLGRPVFLAGGFVLYGLGVVVAAWSGAGIDWQRLAWGQAFITLTQLMTQYGNEYFDFESDRANRTPTRWSGGSRVLVAGELPRDVALVISLVTGAVALLVGIVFSLQTGTPVLALPLVILIVVLAWEYSAPPLRFEACGLGEAMTALLVTVVTPVFGFCLQTGVLATPALLAAIAPLFCLQFAMLVGIEMPDAESDAATGKDTLVVLLGARRMAQVHGFVVIGAYASLLLSAGRVLPWFVAASASAVAPFGVWQVLRMRRLVRAPSPSWSSLAFWSVALFFLTALAELLHQTREQLLDVVSSRLVRGYRRRSREYPGHLFSRMRARSRVALRKVSGEKSPAATPAIQMCRIKTSTLFQRSQKKVPQRYLVLESIG